MQKDYFKEFNENPKNDFIAISEDNFIVFPKDKVNYFIEKAKKQISVDNANDVLIGLLLLTGRRKHELLGKSRLWHIRDIDVAIKETAELCPSATLNSIQSILDRVKKWRLQPSQFLLFSCETKTSEIVPQPFVIPVLEESTVILERFLWLQNYFLQYQKTLSEKTHATPRSRLTSVNSDMSLLHNYGHDFAKECCNIKVLRSLYAAIFWHTCNIENKNKGLVYRLILGHDIESRGTFTYYDTILFEDDSSKL